MCIYKAVWIHISIKTPTGLCYTFYAPNFEEVEGAYWFSKLRGHIGLGLSMQSVSLSVSQSVCDA